MKRCRDLLTMYKEEKKRRKEKGGGKEEEGGGISARFVARCGGYKLLCRLIEIGPRGLISRFQDLPVSGGFAGVVPDPNADGSHGQEQRRCTRTRTITRWFVVSKNHHRAHLIPSNPLQLPEASAVVAVRGGIYVIGGHVNGYFTSDVLFLDCWSPTWSRVTPMRMHCACAAATVVDGKIYVFGGCVYGEKENWGEVFDPKTQTWDSLPKLEDDRNTKYIHHSVVVEGKVYLVDSLNSHVIYYLPRKCKWGRRKHLTDLTDKRSWCVIDNLVYSCGVNGRIYWCEREELDRCDDKDLNWRLVQGFELQCLQERLHASRLVHFGGDGDKAKVWESPVFASIIKKPLEELLIGVRLTSFGRNLLLFWDVLAGSGHKSLEIWCADISLERVDTDLIMGNVECPMLFLVAILSIALNSCILFLLMFEYTRSLCTSQGPASRAEWFIRE